MTGQTGQAVNQADGTPKGFEDISIATEWASFKVVKMKKKLFFYLTHFHHFICFYVLYFF